LTLFFIDPPTSPISTLSLRCALSVIPYFFRHNRGYNRGTTLEFPRKLWLTFSVFLLATNVLHAEGTHTWEQSKFDDLSKGTPKGVAIRSTGGLELAPAFKPVST